MADSGPARRTAGAFDIRTIIALLFVIYGAVLTVVGVLQPAAEVAKAAGVNINLWAGIGMLVFSGLFALWVRLRPIVVPESGTES
ncbi:hypothetical protein [Saccharopolyspora rosea]|uniref:Uncharacterized protein n=1 Tax=Saccharopolyspora rosea TaxID=524884 RepID=A0ABW3FWB7_9PSEU|nr:hypothetical protein [Saccharopolyspora rosea]